MRIRDNTEKWKNFLEFYMEPGTVSGTAPQELLSSALIKARPKSPPQNLHAIDPDKYNKFIKCLVHSVLLENLTNEAVKLFLKKQEIKKLQALLRELAARIYAARNLDEFNALEMERQKYEAEMLKMLYKELDRIHMEAMLELERCYDEIVRLNEVLEAHHAEYTNIVSEIAQGLKNDNLWPPGENPFDGVSSEKVREFTDAYITEQRQIEDELSKLSQEASAFRAEYVKTHPGGGFPLVSRNLDAEIAKTDEMVRNRNRTDILKQRKQNLPQKIAKDIGGIPLLERGSLEIITQSANIINNEIAPRSVKLKTVRENITHTENEITNMKNRAQEVHDKAEEQYKQATLIINNVKIDVSEKARVIKVGGKDLSHTSHETKLKKMEEMLEQIERQKAQAAPSESLPSNFPIQRPRR